MQAHIVVGSNFGDEGKGKTVDYLTHELRNSIVVRANGGSQVGHTVQVGNERHVFNHFGCGHYNNVPTYFSKYFIANPLKFFKEMKVIKNHKVYINKDALLSTPYDMMLNQAQEFARTKRHGSCGMGINETMKRCAIPEFKTTIASIDSNFAKTFERLYNEYFIPEFKRRNLEMFECNVSNMIANFAYDCENFLNHVEIVEDDFLMKFDNVVFENGQGLLLDQDHPYFPYVTHSKTGVHNPVELLQGLGMTEAEVYYVTRTYLTKHGTGPLEHEVDHKIYDGIVDETNIPNEFQGTLRYAPFNQYLFSYNVAADIRSVSDFNLNANVVITCIDQLPETARYIDNDGRIIDVDKNDLIGAIDDIMFDKMFLSNGPDRYNMEKS